MSVVSQANKGEFITLKPQSEELQPYIAYYYFHSKSAGDPVRFIFYPHIRNGLTIYKNSDTIVENNKATTRPSTDLPFKFLYSGIVDHGVRVEIHPPFDKIGVAFEPLGINHFMDVPLGNLIDTAQHDFNYYSHTMTTVLHKVYNAECMEDKVNLLDDYFLSCFVPFMEKRLIQAVNRILNNENKLSVQELSEALCTSRKTLLRLFQKHMNCSVRDFIHVAQFRRAIKTYQTAIKKPHLGEIAMRTDYYDQSDFIRHFRKITGFNPKKFFNSIELVGSEDTFWTFS